ncbi:MAG: type IV pilus biogenesis/stability protein PilW [Thiohalocapsa sp.]
MKRAIAAFLSSLVLVACGGGGAATKSRPGTMADESPADLYVNMAAAYYQRGQMDAALDRGQQAISEDKNSPRAHYVLGIVYQRLGNTQQAQQHFGEAVKLEPDNPDFLNAHGSMLCLDRKYAEAITQFQRALKNPLYKTPEVALMNAADCAKRAARGGESERFMREALSANANYAPALLAMAKLSFDRGAYQEARNYMGRYSRVGQVRPEALLLASRIETRLGNPKNAKALADSLRARFPDAPEVMQL